MYTGKHEYVDTCIHNSFNSINYKFNEKVIFFCHPCYADGNTSVPRFMRRWWWHAAWRVRNHQANHYLMDIAIPWQWRFRRCREVLHGFFNASLLTCQRDYGYEQYSADLRHRFLHRGSNLQLQRNYRQSLFCHRYRANRQQDHHLQVSLWALYSDSWLYQQWVYAPVPLHQ